MKIYADAAVAAVWYDFATVSPHLGLTIERGALYIVQFDSPFESIPVRFVRRFCSLWKSRKLIRSLRKQSSIFWPAYWIALSKV